jgi:hypothetical protein
LPGLGAAQNALNTGVRGGSGQTLPLASTSSPATSVSCRRFPPWVIPVETRVLCVLGGLCGESRRLRAGDSQPDFDALLQPDGAHQGGAGIGERAGSVAGLYAQRGRGRRPDWRFRLVSLPSGRLTDYP